MDFEEIMRTITSGLTGDSQEDAKYLTEQMERYKDHEMGKEIVRACGRLLYSCVPEDERKKLDRLVNNDLMFYESVLDEARFKQHEKKYDEALDLVEGMIRKLEEANMFADDQVSEYHCFNEFFEKVLYIHNAEPTRDVRQATIPMDEIYMQQGSLLIDLKRYEKAEEALKKAMHWNPANARIAFEHAETSKLLGDMDGFFRLTLDIFKYAFYPKDVARCYRNLGFYFTEKELWEEPVACHTMSLQFEPDSTMAMSELYYIQQKAGKTIPTPPISELKKFGEKYGFPVGAHPDVLGLAYAYGKHFAENGDHDGARYCWQIFYNLTDDEEMKEKLDQLPKE